MESWDKKTKLSELQRSELDLMTHPDPIDPIKSTFKTSYAPIGSLDNEGPVRLFR